MDEKRSDQNEIPTFGRNSRNWLVDLVLVLVHLRNASNYLVSDHYLSLSFNLSSWEKAILGAVEKFQKQMFKHGNMIWPDPTQFFSSSFPDIPVPF